MVKKLVIDPPQGYSYGFPKVIPWEVYQGDQQQFEEWLFGQGYPIELMQLAMTHSRYWEEEFEK